MVNGGDAVGRVSSSVSLDPEAILQGYHTLRPELSGKRLDIFKEIVPNLSRMAVFASTNSSDYAQVSKEIRVGRCGLRREASIPRQSKVQRILRAAFRAATKVRAQAVLVRVPGPTLGARRAHFPELAAKNRLPAMYERAEDVEVGGLMSIWPEHLRLVPPRRNVRG